MADIYEAVIHQLECEGFVANRKELEAYGAHMLQLMSRLGPEIKAFLPTTPEGCLHAALSDSGIWQSMLDWLNTYRGGVGSAH